MRIDDEHRVGKYRKDPQVEQRLEEMNSALSALEPQLSTTDGPPRWPVIFIVGTPRSGSTLLAQALASTGGLAYPTNFLARFWRAPCVGATIERALGDLDAGAASDYSSDYGVTRGWTSPHEFGYFWERWFTYRDTHKVSEEDLALIDRDEMRCSVEGLISAYDKPFFFKSLVCGLQLPFLRQVFPDALFIHNRRDAVFNAQSILQGRISRLGGRDRWYSIRPSQYDELKSLPVAEQIAAQVVLASEEVRVRLEGVPADRRTSIDYETL
jgi:hypothetical protein